MPLFFYVKFIWEGLTPLFFLCIIPLWSLKNMDTENLRVIISNLESILECLKSEVSLDVPTYEQVETSFVPLDDYDEVFYDDED